MDKKRTITKQKERLTKSNYIIYSGLAFQMVAGIGLVAWFGHWLDGVLKLKYPYFLFLLVIIVFVGMIVQLHKQISKE